MAAHQNLASKIFCLCCRHCEEPQSTDDSKTSSQTQEQQSAIHSLQKDELGPQNPEHTTAASSLPPGRPLVHPAKTASAVSSSELEDLNIHDSQRGFYKRNLNRYSRDHWPFQPCLIGRP
uniref:Testis expressed 48 n=1 Tax=Equus asinus TaxID=9793 RepID=A0A8C4MZ90_EQUAS|nr:testis-expressed protein 48 [Equus asinus]